MLLVVVVVVVLLLLSRPGLCSKQHPTLVAAEQRSWTMRRCLQHSALSLVSPHLTWILCGPGGARI